MIAIKSINKFLSIQQTVSAEFKIAYSNSSTVLRNLKNELIPPCFSLVLEKGEGNKKPLYNDLERDWGELRQAVGRAKV